MCGGRWDSEIVKDQLMKDLECHYKKVWDFIFLDNDKPFKILKQETHMFRISFLENNFSCSMENGLESEKK